MCGYRWMRLWCVEIPKKLQRCLICVKGGCQLATFKWNESLVLCRYEKLPLDFRTPFIFNMENFPQPSNNAVPLSMAANRTASSTLASLSRYFLHQRWVWAVQSSQGSAVAMQAVAHILSMLSEWVHTLNLWWDVCFFCPYSVHILITFLDIPLKVAVSLEKIAHCWVSFIHCQIPTWEWDTTINYLFSELLMLRNIPAKYWDNKTTQAGSLQIQAPPYTSIGS